MFKSVLATTLLFTTPAVTTSLISTTVIVQAQTRSCTDYGTFIQCTDGTYCTKFGNTTQCSGNSNNNGSNILTPIKPITPNNSGIGKALDNSAKINRLSRPQYRPVRPQQPTGLVTSQEVDWRWEMKCNDKNKSNYVGTFTSFQSSDLPHIYINNIHSRKNALASRGRLSIRKDYAELNVTTSNGRYVTFQGAFVNKGTILGYKLELKSKACEMTAITTKIGQIVQR